MKKIVKAVAMLSVFASGYTYSSNDDKVTLIPQSKEAGISYKKASPLSALSEIANQDEAKISAVISSYYEALQNGQEIPSTRSFALYAIMLQNMLPTLCENNFEKQENKTIQDYFSTAAKVSGSSAPVLMESEIKSLASNDRVQVKNETFAILIMTKVVCEQYLDDKEQSPESVINRSGYELGSTVVMDDAVLSNEIEKMKAAQFGKTPEQMRADKEKQLDELKRNGFITVEDDSIRDIESTYEDNKDSFEAMNQVQEKLAFVPTTVQESGSFKFLGAEAVGAETSSGHSSVSQVYETPIGKMLILEEDKLVSKSFTTVEPEFLNTDIAGVKGSVLPQRGKEDGKFITEIYWSNPVTNREYTVEVNKNLNDPENTQSRKEVIEFLSNNFKK